MPKLLKYLHSNKTKETISEDYSPTDKTPSVSLPCTSSSACKRHSLLSKSCYTVSSFLVKIQQICPKQALLVQNSLLCALRINFKADIPRSPPQAFSLTQPKGGPCVWKQFGCHCGQHGTVFNCFLDRKVICMGNKWWQGNYRMDKEGGFCRSWCWMWAWDCGT